MKIAIDLTQIPAQLTGVGFYMENLVKALNELHDDNEYYLFLKPSALATFQVPSQRFKYIIVPKRPYIFRVLWEQFVLPLYLLFMKIDILHSPHYTTPLFGWWFKRVVTFPDMTFFLFPEMHQRWKVSYFQTMTKLSARFADRIISISHSTTQDIVNKLGVPVEKVATTQLAVSPKYQPGLDKRYVAAVKTKYNLPLEYILFVGTIEPRKNIIGLVRAYFALPQAIKDRFSLVIVGKKGWHYQELFFKVKNSSDRSKIVFPGYVTEDDLPAIYGGASLFVYPSFYEGFGIPVLEALACGVPTITSNLSSMPEVAGNAGLLFDPNNVEELTKAMMLVLNEPARAKKMIDMGLNQAAAFSWKKCAQETLAVYNGVLISRAVKR
jgi:glycosyltransferase involved in cell wall biosynthesis